MGRPKRNPTGASGAKKCATCGREKPLDAFGRDAYTTDGLNRDCRGCVRIASAAQRETPAYKKWEAAYTARPDVRARKAGCHRKHYLAALAKHGPKKRTARQNLIMQRCTVRNRIERMAAQLERQKSRLRELEAEIARMDRGIDGELHSEERSERFARP